MHDGKFAVLLFQYFCRTLGDKPAVAEVWVGLETEQAAALRLDTGHESVHGVVLEGQVTEKTRFERGLVPVDSVPVADIARCPQSADMLVGDVVASCRVPERGLGKVPACGSGEAHECRAGSEFRIRGEYGEARAETRPRSR